MLLSNCSLSVLGSLGDTDPKNLKQVKVCPRYPLENIWYQIVQSCLLFFHSKSSKAENEKIQDDHNKRVFPSEAMPAEHQAIISSDTRTI